MSSQADRISHLVSRGKISSEEGERLRLAMAPVPGTQSAWRLLINPFDRFGGGRAAWVGVGVSAASVALGHLGARFDGFLDVHSSSNVAFRPSYGASLREQAAGWLVPSLLFWIFARITSRHVRLIDFVGFVGLSRALLLAIGIVVVAVDPAIPTAAAPLTPSLAFVVVATLPLLAWFFILLFTGFRNASGLAEAKLVGGFCGVLLASEIVSTLLLTFPR